MAFDITLSKKSNDPVTVKYQTNAGSASANDDYTHVSPTQVTIPAGSTKVTVSIPIVNDTLDEEDEQFTVTLSEASGASIADGSGTGTITDNDDPPGVSIGDKSVTEADTDITIAFPVTLAKASGKKVTVQYATAQGTALSDIDFEAATGSIEILAGSTTGYISIIIKGDDLYEDYETFKVQLTGAENATIVDSEGQGGINNDDTMPRVSISDVSEVNEGEQAVFIVSLDAPSGKPVTVFYIDSPGTAFRNDDYSAKTGSVVFQVGPNGETSTHEEVSVQTIEDTKDEADETFNMNLYNVVGASVDDDVALATIIDDDLCPTIVVSPGNIPEGHTDYFWVSLVGSETEKTVTVDFQITGGTASNPQDYTVAQQTIVFNPGDRTKAVAVAAAADNVVEDPNEYFDVQLVNAVNGSISATYGSSRVTILGAPEFLSEVDTYPTTSPISANTDSYHFYVSASGDPGDGLLGSIAIDAVAPAGRNFTYSIQTGDTSKFQINSATGEITVAGSLGDPAGGTVYPLQIKVVDADEAQLYDLASVTITAYKVEYKSIKFTSDHGLLRKSTSFSDTGTLYSEPEWYPGRATDPNAPISHTMGTNVTLELTLTVSPAGISIPIPYSLEGDGPGRYLDFSKSGTLSSGDNALTMTSPEVIPSAISDDAGGAIAWNLEVNGDSGKFTKTSGPHKMYVTAGTPSGSVVTETRMAWAVGKAPGAVGGVPDKLWDAVAAETTFGGGGVDGWSLLDGGSGDCDNQARLMMYAVQMLHAGSAEVKFVRASTNAGAGNCLDLETRVVGGVTQYLILDFDTGVGYNWNQYEGVCVVGGNYYAITPKKKEADDYEILDSLSAQQYWVEIDWSGGGWSVTAVHAEVPKP